MRGAFKEWAVVVDALGRGDQIIILRKGGLSEGPGGFQVEHPEFLLFPTLFHQQRESVLPQARSRFDALAASFPGSDTLRLEFFAKVVSWHRLDSWAAAQRLRGQHIWLEEVIAERFEWGRGKSIFALAVRVFRLPLSIELPMAPAYGGCKSWVELEQEVGIDGARAVLDDAAFSLKLDSFRSALAEAEPTHP